MVDYGIIIAVEKYADNAIKPVAYAERDALAVEAALAALGFTTTTLLSAKATKATIESTVRRIAASALTSDSIYLFFAGHGFSKDDRNYLKCHDTVHGDQLATSVELQSVFSALRKCKATRVALFLDACESGSEPDPNVRGIFSALNDAELEAFFKDAEGAVCFAACKSNESSYSHSSLRHGIWTYHLLEALSGRAKLAMERGFVTATTLQNYLAHEVPLRVRALRNRPDPQNPWATGAMTKEFVVADLRSILEARKKERLAAAKQITQAYLSGEERVEVRSLSGLGPAPMERAFSRII
jgi:hypothetical protein